MQKKISPILVLLCMLIPYSTPADSAGFYASGGFGRQALDIEGSDDPVWASAFQGTVGYRLFPNLAVEAWLGLDISRGGSDTESENTVTVSDDPANPSVTQTLNVVESVSFDHYASLFLKPELPLGDFGIYALLGFTYVELETELSSRDTVNAAIRPVLSSSQRSIYDSSVSYGIGMNYYFDDVSVFNIDWTYLIVDQDWEFIAESGRSSYDIYSINASWSYMF